MSRLDDMYGKQAEFDDVDEVWKALEAATTKAELNLLRMACAKAGLIAEWQKKFQSASRCSECGRRL